MPRVGRAAATRPVLAGALAVLVSGCGDAPRRAGPAPSPSPTPAARPAATPAPDGALPRTAGGLAAQLTDVKARLDRAVGSWADPADGAPPEAVTVLALRHQRLQQRLAAEPGLARRVLPRLGGRLRAEVRDLSAAQRALARLNPPADPRRFRTGPAEPAGRLLAHYREATRRSHVGWPLLAAVNLVESGFGRLRNDSTAGAQGPMQFIPSSWRTYGDGGDVHDPRDAILGAARFLHAAGAPADERAALYAYNPSPLYVIAVSRYARVMRRDRRAFLELYAWPVAIRTRDGLRRLTGPGVTSGR